MIEKQPFNSTTKSHSLPVREPVTYTTVALLIISTLLVAFSLYWNINNLYLDQFNHALSEAKANWNKDQAFRTWATKHGGVYVKPDKRTQPNPYMSHIPNRDIVTTDGMKLTLLNPAYMMRQMIKEYEADYGIKGSITARTVLNPENKADAWELKALDVFEDGTQEIYEETTINDITYLRYMKPMIVKEGCLKCHTQKGLKVGDISGGVSVSVPMKPYLSLVDTTTQSIVITHLLILLLSYAGIIAYGWMARNREAERIEHLELLEERVRSRTQALKVKEKEAQEHVKRLDQIMDTAAEGIITSNQMGIIESFNHAAEKIFGYSASEIIGKNINTLIPEQFKKDHNDYIDQYLKTGESVIIGVGREVEAQRKDGTIFPASVAISDMQFDSKRIFTAIVHDITLNKQHELTLIQAKEEAEKINQIKTDFLSSMSHDLRTPLNAIIGFGQLLEANPGEPLSVKQKQFVTQILKGGDHLLHMINDILDLAKIEANKVDILLDDLHIKSVLGECLILIKPLADEHNINIIENFKENKNALVRADNTRLIQVLLNIISNAIKYNKENGSIIIGYSETSDNKIKISIKDTGIGIAKDKQKDLFTPFTRIDAGKSNIEGTGIGLTVSRKLISLMQGSINFESEPNIGSTFWIEIPLANDSEKKTNKISEHETSSTIYDLHGTLLYVEDNPANLRLMEALVSNIRNLNLLSATTASKGIALAKEKQPDIIILDINLPDMSGIDAYKELKATAETSHIPVMALSANASRHDIEKGLATGFEFYLTKPMNINEVVSAMNTILNKNKS